MDVSMPHLNGIEATRIIAGAMPHVRIIGLSAHEEEDMATALIRAGASAFLSKGGPAQDLIAIIRACCKRTAAAAT
jgi:DNA-binding NarL/FixJ family response regulator